MSKHLEKYMIKIKENLAQVSGQVHETEALLFAFSTIHEKIQFNGMVMYNHAQEILQNYTFPMLSSEEPLMQARACQVYGKYACYKFANQDHMNAALDKIIQYLWSPHDAVKVEAAIAVSIFLEHQETAVDLVRPGLGKILKVYLQIMDEIDFEDLVISLRRIVDAFENEIAPYAQSLCIKLQEAFCRLVKSSKNGDNKEEIDSEMGLTAERLMTAIRRVL